MRTKLLLLGIFTATLGFGQLKIVETSDLITDVNQTTLEEIGQSSDNELIKVVWVINTGSTTLTLKCKKTEIDVLANTMNTTCWVLCPSIYDWAGGVPSGFVTLGGNQMTETVAPGDTIKSFAGHYKPENLDGCSLFRYDWYDENDLNTSLADINIRYIHTTGTCTAGVEENASSTIVKLSPNPANDNVAINIEGLSNYSDISIEIYDMLGKRVSVITNVGETNFVNVESFKKGFYFVSIKREGTLIRTSKLIKE